MSTRKSEKREQVIVRKPVETVRCGAGCAGVLMRVGLSRLEEGLGHEGFECDVCRRRVKYVPEKR